MQLPEWTSNEYKGYGLPYALRASLPALSRDGIPTLPHLLDPHLEEEAPKTTPKFAKQLGARSQRYAEQFESNAFIKRKIQHKMSIIPSILISRATSPSYKPRTPRPCPIYTEQLADCLTQLRLIAIHLSVRI
ncbi:hypothetical protein PCANC_19686 [Puccinia coronata f. sp. avenae]|uniref:Uncharacterized protein n=1 Tax=Puccinia coronata f. sp. avenae TaxID=200324 RepID=A0A2N5SAZ0_9BASI|nr:hypothetical protein PCANC_19686 [Puccinia coronata f. sp. avenae]